MGYGKRKLDILSMGTIFMIKFSHCYLQCKFNNGTDEEEG